jgi:hypothetical protein
VDDVKWERWTALSGVIVAALLLIRTLFLTPVPPLTSDPSTLGGFYFAHASKLQLQVFLTGVIVILGTWFFGGLRAYLVRAGADRLANIMFAGWIMQGALALVRHSFLAVPALAYTTQLPILMIYNVASIMLGFVWMCAFIIAGATSLASSRAGALPSWFGWGTAIVAVIMLLGSLAVSEPAGYFSRFGDFRWVVLYTYIGWVAVTSILLYQGLGAEDRQPSSSTD